MVGQINHHTQREEAMKTFILLTRLAPGFLDLEKI